MLKPTVLTVGVLTGALLALATAAAAPAAEADPADPRTVRRLRVFLADFEDVPHPESYTRERFQQLFFGLGEPRLTPEGRAMSGSVREYFLDISDGRLDVEGEVCDWVRLPGRITRIPHWKHGMEPFGESWPVIVAQTLRTSGIVGPDAPDKVRLADGRLPDLLVFLNTDWGTGGVNRGWGHLREVLGKMHVEDLWDEGWLRLPSPLSSYSASKWRNAPASAPDGTIDAVPPAAELEMFPLSVMMHEMGHQLANLPDVYGPAFEPWGVFDLMGGPAAETHHPMGVSAYQRVNSGWMAYTDVAPAPHLRLLLRPLASHKEALRFAQGPGQEVIVAENRACLVYPRDWGEPPANRGPRLLFYRLDPAGRRRRMYGVEPQGKITTVIRRPDPYGEVWGEPPFTDLTAATSPTSRNSLGELWYEFRDLRPGADGEIQFEADGVATDLVAAYDRAEWRTGDGQALATGRFERPAGHVGLRWCSGPDAGPRRRSLELRIGTSGSVGGRFRVPATGPRRLYLLARLPEGEPAAHLTLSPAGAAAAVEVELGAATRSVSLVVEIPATATDLECTLRAGSPAAAARVWIDAAWLVGLPPPVLDLAATTPPKGWTPAPAAADPGPAPAAVATLALRDGSTYGPQVLALPLGAPAAASGWRAEWPLRVPDTPVVLRGLLGFAADTPADSRARLTLTLVGPAAREWPIYGNLEIATAAGTAPEPSVVLEALLPREAAGQDVTLVLTVAAESARPARLAVPCLAVAPP